MFQFASKYLASRALHEAKVIVHHGHRITCPPGRSGVADGRRGRGPSPAASSSLGSLCWMGLWSGTALARRGVTLPTSTKHVTNSSTVRFRSVRLIGRFSTILTLYRVHSPFSTLFNAHSTLACFYYGGLAALLVLAVSVGMAKAASARLYRQVTIVAAAVL